jgi:hypothetical protein
MRRLAAVLLLVALGGPIVASAKSPATFRVLFIGNSGTYFNNLPALVAAVAGVDGRHLETQMVVAPGASLKKHWEDGAALDAIRRTRWNYVVLQEQSTFGNPPSPVNRVNDPAVFHEYARRFDGEIRKAGATTVFFLMWAHQDRPDTQARITDAFVTIARELHARLAPIGLAWERALAERPGFALYHDRVHPTPAGSYLAACVLHATMFGTPPHGIPTRVLGRPVDLAGRIGNDGQGLVTISDEEAAWFTRLAWTEAAKHRR